MSKRKEPVTHLVLARSGVSFCKKIIRTPEMRWTHQVALTTCKLCLKAHTHKRPGDK